MQDLCAIGIIKLMTLQWMQFAVSLISDSYGPEYIRRGWWNIAVEHFSILFWIKPTFVALVILEAQNRELSPPYQVEGI